MDFPKKQAQRLMPLYLLEYSEKLFTNHPDPSAPWGGGGSDYTAGQGITITNNEISVDTNVIATKSDISSMVTTTQLNDALDDYALKTEIPTDVSQLYNDAGYATETWVQNQGYSTFSGSYNDLTDKPELPDFTKYYYLNNEIQYGGHKTAIRDYGLEYSKEWDENKVIINVENADMENKASIVIQNNRGKKIEISDRIDVYDDLNTGVSVEGDKVAIHSQNQHITSLNDGKLTYGDGILREFNLPTSKEMGTYTLATTDDIPLSTITTLESLALEHTTQINSINSNITDLQTLTSTHTSQISGINSSITSLESLVNTNTSNISTIENNLSTISSNITTLEELTSTHTSQISALQTSVSNCVTLSQLSTTLSDYALKSEVPSYSLSTTSTPVLSSATLSQSYETLTFTYADNTTASFNFLTTGTTLSTSTVNVLNSTTLS